MKNNFFDSYHCVSKFHCKSCRDIDGEDFRKQVKENFDDIDEINFDCPHGIPWGAQGENLEVPKNDYDDKNMVNIDMVKGNRQLFEKIEGLSAVLDEYERKVKKSKCSPCLKAKINRNINKVLVVHIQKYKDIELLNNLQDDLVLADGITDKKISEWKSKIQNVI